ncbi:MAG TPA: STAS domain-containing protein [Patescibacteria group bacterium]|nr:STAS domain-containing protein [Patescibacteria group bacterium]
MEFKIDSRGSETLVVCTGRMMFADTSEFLRLSEDIKLSDGKVWVLEFSDLAFIDSAGLGMLLMIRELIETQSGKVSIRGAAGQVRKALDLAKFQELICIET